MKGGKIVRFQDAERHATSPTETTHFLDIGTDTEPGVSVETLASGDGPPLHRHPWASWSVVMEGAIRARIEDELIDLGTGDYMYTEPNAVHTFMATSPTAKVAQLDVPGDRFVAMSREVAPLVMKGADPSELAPKAARYGVEILGPPLAVSQG